MSDDAVQQIKDRLSIVDVVSPYVELHNAGRSMKGKSPFTNERTPSFFVSPDRGMYYCFSSNQGGDIFTFIQTMEGVDFKGALKILAEKAGVEIVKEDPKKRTERDKLYTLLETAQKFYENQLSKETEALSYLKDRGLKADTIKAWRLGYAPGPPQHGWRHLREHLNQEGFTDAEMQKAGLIKGGNEGKTPYDVFRDRVVFPINDPSGRVIAFSGRLLHKSDEVPKYVNSPDTELFNKSHALFGFDKAKQGIRQYDFSLVVEGQFDVVLSHQAGYTNAVAVSGTAMTEDHTSLLQRLSNRVVLALDADTAGIRAVKRSADLMLKRGMDIKVAELPKDEDPADIIKEDVARFREIIGSSVDVISFLLSTLKADSKDDRAFKLRVRDEVVPYVLKIPSHIDRDHFIGVIADAIGGSKDAVLREVTRLEASQETESSKPSLDSNSDNQDTNKQEAPANQINRLQSLFAYFAVLYELLSDREAALVKDWLFKNLEEDIDQLKNDMDEKTLAPLTFRLEEELASMNEHRRHYELAGYLEELKQCYGKTKIKELKANLLEAERQEDEAKVSQILKDIGKYQNLLSQEPVSEEIFNGD